MALKISLIYVWSCEKRNHKQIHMLGPNFRSEKLEIVILDRSSFYRAICQTSHLVSIAVSIELSIET